MLKSSIAVTVVLSALIPAKAWAADGWIIHQKTISGEATVYISPTIGMKTVDKASSITSVGRLPDGRFIIWNDKTKVYADVPLSEFKKQKDQFMDSATGFMSAAGQVETPMQKGSSGEIAGLRATQYFQFKSNAKLNRMMQNLGEKGEAQRKTELWIADDIKLPSDITQVLSPYRVPQAQGLVLKVTSSISGRPVNLIDSIKSERAQIADSDFNAPAGYKRIADAMAVAGGPIPNIGADDTAKVRNMLDADVKASKPIGKWVQQAKSGNSAATMPPEAQKEMENVRKMLKQYGGH